jgi:Chaperone of endosialidase
MNPLVQFKTTLILPILSALALACSAFSPRAQAAQQPPQANTPANTSVGFQALQANTTGVNNTALGVKALFLNTTGSNNTATGSAALYSNTTGEVNVATGEEALSFNTTGTRNTATGVQALLFNTTGSRNTATGFSALQNNETGDHNAAYGWAALLHNTGSLNIGLGDGAGNLLTTGDNNIDIGNFGVAGEANTIRIGTQVFTPDPPIGLDRPAHTATYIAGISGQTASGGVAVYINSDGKLGTLTSSARFKTDIKPMEKTSEMILALKPVTFRYKKEVDPKGISQFGLVAEEVEKVNPDLVARDAEGKVYSVRYEAVNAMLLNEFLKEHATVRELKKEIAELKVGLQKVSAQVELSNPAPQTVVNSR